MKIVALVNQGYKKTYLAEVSQDEIATIKRGAIYAESQENGIEVGTQILVGDHWKRVRNIDEMQGRIESAAKSLHAMADLLATIDVVVKPAQENEGGAK